MKTIQEAKEFAINSINYGDVYSPAILRAIDIALAADALFDMATTAPVAGQPTRNDRKNALYREVRTAREEGYLPGNGK